MNEINGIAIVSVPHMKPYIEAPRRMHKRARWDRSGSYHKRVQKKWLKRFGTARQMSVIFDGMRYYMNPLIVDQLRAAIAESGAGEKG